MKGFVVYDDASTAKRPGIIMVHEWWGITPHIHNEAKKYAAQGYTAFIADMYGDAKTADNPKDAGALSGGVMKDPKAMESRFNAAKAELAKQSTVNPDRIGAVAEVAADDVPATSHPMPLVNVFRDDVVRPTLSHEDALSGAPSVESDRFRVPRILDEE